MIDLSFSFTADIWVSGGTPGAWHFITLPQDIAEQIKAAQQQHLGFGTIKVTATIGDASWATSLFPDNKLNSYLLPVKANIRKKAKLHAGDTVETHLKLGIDI